MGPERVTTSAMSARGTSVISVSKRLKRNMATSVNVVMMMKSEIMSRPSPSACRTASRSFVTSAIRSPVLCLSWNSAESDMNLAKRLRRICSSTRLAEPHSRYLQKYRPTVIARTRRPIWSIATPSSWGPAVNTASPSMTRAVIPGMTVWMTSTVPSIMMPPTYRGQYRDNAGPRCLSLFVLFVSVLVMTGQDIVQSACCQPLKPFRAPNGYDTLALLRGSFREVGCLSEPMRTQADPNLAIVYAQLAAAWGPQHWWPGDTPFEVAVGAVLTQNTAWSNVEKAITSLKAAGAMTAAGLLALSASDLEQAIRSAGYYRVKARYLRTLALWVAQRAAGDLSSLASEDIGTLRCEVLALHGVGRETADSILLYAIGKPAFVVDAYTRRIAARLRLLPDNATYETTQQYFVTRLSEDAHLFNEFHALLVRLAKEHCRTRPVCLACPLEQCCPSADASPATGHAARVRTMPERRTTP